MQTIWGMKKRCRSTAVTMTMLIEHGQLIDPWQAIPCDLIYKLRRQVLNSPETGLLIRTILEEDTTANNGLAHAINWALDQLRWKLIPGSWMFKRHKDTDLPLLDGGNRFFKHELRRSARWAVLGRAPKRVDVPGLGVKYLSDRITTVFIRKRIKRDISAAHCVPRERATAICRSIIAGATYTEQWKYNAKLVEEPTCRFCETPTNTHKDTHDHRLECPMWQQIRQMELSQKQINNILQHPLRARTTIVNEPDYITALRNRLAQTLPPPFTPKMLTINKIYTDGACSNQSIHEIRTAGCGIWGDLGALSMSFPLPGLDQSAVRAEVYAIKIALEATIGDVKLYCDNKYTVDTLLALKANPFFIPDDHLDLWADIGPHLMDRNVEIYKVKAHLTREQAINLLENNPDSVEEWEGNTWADKLAVAGNQPLEQMQVDNYHSLIEENYSLQAVLTRIAFDITKANNNHIKETNQITQQMVVDEAITREQHAEEQINRTCWCRGNRRITTKTTICKASTGHRCPNTPHDLKIQGAKAAGIELIIINSFPDTTAPIWEQFYQKLKIKRGLIIPFS